MLFSGSGWGEQIHSELEERAAVEKALLIECSNLNRSLRQCIPTSRLHSFEPNYLAYQDTHRQDKSLEALMSFRYTLTRPDCYDLRGKDMLMCLSDWDYRKEIYFSYTQKFDFFIGSRDSGPVVNRLNNPAFHVKWYLPNTENIPVVKYLGDLRYFEMSLEHRSNGQVFDAGRISRGIYISENAFNAGNYELIDSVSRSSNFLALSFGKDLMENVDNRLKLKLKLHFKNAEDQVHWGRAKGKDRSFQDYDLLSFDWHLINAQKRHRILRLKSRIGLAGLSESSWDIDYYFPAYKKQTREFTKWYRFINFI